MFEKYWGILERSYTGYAKYLWSRIQHPDWHNFFYWLIALSLLVWMLELVFPWRKNQKAFRKDFWLDAFYMFFNFFLFSLILYNGLSNVVVELFNDFLRSFGINNLVAIRVGNLPVWGQWLLMFVLVDFIQWNTHRLLHRVPFLWRFHRIHHSVKEMGFAAHLRFHWMETIVYKSIMYLPMAMIGFGIDDFFVVHWISVLIGHLNHANLGWDYGWLRYLFNNPKMHIWHHAKQLPEERKFGVNFGLSLSIWDYLFQTAYIPHNGRDIEIGIEDQKFPNDFLGQNIYPFKRESD